MTSVVRNRSRPVGLNRFKDHRFVFARGLSYQTTLHQTVDDTGPLQPQQFGSLGLVAARFAERAVEQFLFHFSEKLTQLDGEPV